MQVPIWTMLAPMLGGAPILENTAPNLENASTDSGKFKRRFKQKATRRNRKPGYTRNTSKIDSRQEKDNGMSWFTKNKNITNVIRSNFYEAFVAAGVYRRSCQFHTAHTGLLDVPEGNRHCAWHRPHAEK